MTIRKVLRLGDPRLRQVSAPVKDLADPALAQLLTDLADTMAAHKGAGLAAPQIDVPLRVVVFGSGEINPRYPEAPPIPPPIPPTILINPELTPLGAEQQEGWEGCLSVPGLRGRVRRWQRLHYRGLTPSGESIDRTVEGFHARFVQHECDHLDGVLFPERLSDPHAFGFLAELEAAGQIPAVPS
jgi:peptide deformylase